MTTLEKLDNTKVIIKPKIPAFILEEINCNLSKNLAAIEETAQVLKKEVASKCAEMLSNGTLSDKMVDYMHCQMDRLQKIVDCSEKSTKYIESLKKYGENNG